MKKLFVAGCGFCGVTAARRLAELGWAVTIVDQRSHIGGNAYDCRDADGVLYHPYGPHVFFTDSEAVWGFIKRFSEWEEYRCKAYTEIDGILFEMPFQWGTFEKMMPQKGGEIIRRLKRRYPLRDTVSLKELLESGDPLLKQAGQFLYEKDYLPYNRKQWDLRPEELAPEVLGRFPIRLGTADYFHCEKYQYMPKEGYADVFRSMLAHPAIQVDLDTESSSRFAISDGRICCRQETYDAVLYTGRLDALFGFCQGILPFRTLQFTKETVSIKNGLPCLSVYYPSADYPFTRRTDYQYLEANRGLANTLLIAEQPRACEQEDDIPYYVTLTPHSKALQEQYRAYARSVPHLYTAGRLADFKYYNMDAAILRGLQVAEKINEMEREGRQ